MTALSRKGSKNTPIDGVKVVPVDYDDEESLISALRGQQFLIITLSVRAKKEVHTQIVTAASKAGVPYIMPNIFGGDAANANVLNDPVIGTLYQERIGEVEKSGSAYVVLVCGQWYEWSLALPKPWFGFDIRQREVTFYDDGKTRVNVSTWDQCGRAVAALLSLPESGASPCVADWKNRQLYVSSFKVSQRDMLDSLNRVLGTTDGDWKIDYEATDKRYQRGLAAMKAGDRSGFATALYAKAFFPNGDGDLEGKGVLDNKTLGLPQEDLDEITRRTVQMVKEGFVEKTFAELSG